MTLQRLFDVLNRIFLCECLLCESPKEHKEGLCPSCVSILPFSGMRCPGCGEHQVTDRVRCPKCILTPFSFDSLVSVFDYKDPIPSLVKQLKFNKKLEWGRLLGYYLSKKLQLHYQGRELPSMIIPVPLSTERLIERGFNQALELALPLRRILNIPLEVNAIYRSRHTQPQARLTAIERRRNCDNVFKSTCSWQGKHVALLDDVVTTGSTVEALALCLKQHGAERVDVWCIAR